VSPSLPPRSRRSVRLLTSRTCAVAALSVSRSRDTMLLLCGNNSARRTSRLLNYYLARIIGLCAANQDRSTAASRYLQILLLPARDVVYRDSENVDESCEESAIRVRSPRRRFALVSGSRNGRALRNANLENWGSLELNIETESRSKFLYHVSIVIEGQSFAMRLVL